ncbi:MAG TPA: hypothetical protein V6C57_26615 [Coleofasciculaceae cyanobacterium]
MKDLYRMVHRRKSDGQIVQIPEYFDFETVQKHVKALNERYSPDYEYFSEKVNLKSLSEQTLLELAYQEKLTLNDANFFLEPMPRSLKVQQMSRA